jgi:hypothetical protein
MLVRHAVTQFKSAAECVEALKKARDAHSYAFWVSDAGRRKNAGQRQVLCATCERWKWPDERCNLFVEGLNR